MKDDSSKKGQCIQTLEKECAYLRRKLARIEQQRGRQEKIEDINRHLLKQANERLLQFHEQARLENISKSDFLTNMSHEIRTPLNIILGMANLLAETELNETQAQYLSSLRITGRQLMEILNNILEFSRIEAGKISVEPEPFNLMKIIAQLEASTIPLCMQKSLEFSVSHDPLLIMERKGDQLKLFQILLNLINNAVKFTASGSVSLKIEESLQEADHLVFHVIDTGIGITPKQQAMIFERFTQANESLSQQHSGAGLGLAISRRLTKAMGGSLRVESAPQQGAVFSCSLPLPPLAPSERAQLRFDAHLIMPEQFPPTTILAVDDIKENLDVIQVYLEEYPVTVTTAANGREALDLLSNSSFDIVLMDVRMPIMDGITATKEIRDKERKLGRPKQIVLAVTAHAFQEQKKRFLEIGFNDVITKPFFRRELVQTLYRHRTMAEASPPPISLGNKILGYCLENSKVEDIPKELQDLLPQLMETIQTDLDSLRSCYNHKDYQELYATAHSLKGVAGMFGFQQLASLVTDLSKSVKANNSMIVTELFDSIDTYTKRLKRKLS